MYSNQIRKLASSVKHWWWWTAQKEYPASANAPRSNEPELASLPKGSQSTATSGKELAVALAGIVVLVTGLFALPWGLSTWLSQYFATHYSAVDAFYTYHDDISLENLRPVFAWGQLLVAYAISYKKATAFPGLFGIGAFILINNTTALVQAMAGITHPL